MLVLLGNERSSRNSVGPLAGHGAAQGTPVPSFFPIAMSHRGMRREEGSELPGASWAHSSRWHSELLQSPEQTGRAHFVTIHGTDGAPTWGVRNW